MAVLAFRLFGALAAWGTAEAGEDLRPTARPPGRSAVFGLLAAALGLTRDDVAGQRTLASAYRLAVAAQGRQTTLRDYRTVQSVEPSRKQAKTGFTSRKQALMEGKVHTKLTERHYIEDGLWRVFLAPVAEAAPGAPDLATLEAALRRPVFGLYLGRRCCPLALPPAPAVLDCDGLTAALAAYSGAGFLPDRSKREFDRLDHMRVKLYWDEGFPSVPEAQGAEWRRDEPLSRTVWTFGERREFFGTFDATGGETGP